VSRGGRARDEAGEGERKRTGGRREADKGFSRVGDLVDSFLEGTGVASQVRRMAVLEEWDGLVGEAIARVARPQRVSEGTVFVEVRSSSWLMELNMMKGEILERLNEGRDEDERFRRLVFVLGQKETDEGRRGGVE
jgi:predicted nucleic acid-binding Zn ribbon protein